MTRSRRKTPIFPHTCAVSEKEDKQIANRGVRRVLKAMLARHGDDELLPDDRELTKYGNYWQWAKDGKTWWHDATERFMRK